MEDYDFIGRYFNGFLSPEEIKRFDQNIREDPAFAESVAFYYNASQEIKNQLAEEKKKRFRELYELQGKDKHNRPPLVFMNKWWKAGLAAAIVTAIGFGLFLFTHPSVNQLADRYINDHLQRLPVTMSTHNNDMQKGANHYNDEDFSVALQYFENIVRLDSADLTAKKNAGIVCLRLKQYDKALEYFEQLEQATLQANPGKFYHALTLMERNQAQDKQKARALLEQIVKEDLEGSENAATWLKNW